MTAIEKINQLVSEYNFPFEAMLDVNHRIECCQDEAYLQQQLRYLKNLIGKGLATKKDLVGKRSLKNTSQKEFNTK